MIFINGQRRAGFFEINIYKKPVLTIKEFDEWVK